MENLERPTYHLMARRGWVSLTHASVIWSKSTDMQGPFKQQAVLHMRCMPPYWRTYVVYMISYSLPLRSMPDKRSQCALVLQRQVPPIFPEPAR